MHKRHRLRESFKLAAWTALKEIAERHGIHRQNIEAYGTGQLVAGVMLNDDNTTSIFAGRCGWHHEGGARVITDMTSFIWLDDAVDPANAVQTYTSLWLPAARPAFACDSDRQARALAALASEGGELPNIERMIDHER